MAVGAAIVAAPALPRGERLAHWQEAATLVTLLLLFVLSAIAISSGAYNPFIYFRF